MRSFGRFAALMLMMGAGVSGLFAGCMAAPGAATSQPVAGAGAMPVEIQSKVIGRSVQGREIECLVIGGTDADVEPVTVLFIATIHGDEAAGTPLLERLGREAASGPAWLVESESDAQQSVRLILVPNANPDGFALQRRGNARGVDLNRNFPAASFTTRRRHGSQPLSEPESRALHDLILECMPLRIISIHQPLACIDYDGDGEGLAHAMADAMPEEHRLKVNKLGAYPGSLGSFAGVDLGIPVITLELPGAASRLNHDELWARYGAMLMAAATYR